MRLWSLHPAVLDAKGLVALWRETLLAQAVLLGRTKGYKNHPQLDRFKAHPKPAAAIGSYLLEIRREAARRGYNFDPTRINPARTRRQLQVTQGQVAYEWEHLRRKLAVRDPARLAEPALAKAPACHPLFEVIPGPVEAWEKL